MFPHDGPLIRIEWAWFFQNGERNARLTDVVQHGCVRETLAVCLAQTDLLPECCGNSCHE